jgi:hypothetical protein
VAEATSYKDSRPTATSKTLQIQRQRQRRGRGMPRPYDDLLPLPKKADPSLRPAPVPQSRDGQEKARDSVRDDTVFAAPANCETAHHSALRDSLKFNKPKYHARVAFKSSAKPLSRCTKERNFAPAAQLKAKFQAQETARVDSRTTSSGASSRCRAGDSRSSIAALTASKMMATAALPRASIG